MKKTIYITFVISLLYLSIAFSLDECKAVLNDNEVPCEVLLPVNVSKTSCESINVTFYTNSTFLYSQFMLEKNSFTCGGNFTQTDFGTYLFFYSTGDSGSIVVEEDINNRYYLYVVASIFFFVLLGLGFYLQEETFAIIAGFLSAVIAVELFTNGFPGLTNTFLQNSIVIVLAGIGFYFMIMPSLDLLQQWKTRMDRFD